MLPAIGLSSGHFGLGGGVGGGMRNPIKGLNLC